MTKTMRAFLCSLSLCALLSAEARLGATLGAPPPAQLQTGDFCASDMDCSLNGVCNATTGYCDCDQAWGGQWCGELQLQPAKLKNGYKQNDTSSWGGTVISGDDGKYHMFVGEMTGHCGLNSWWRNECFMHATSDTPDGPYAPQSQVAPAAATCPHARVHNGTWLIFHTACGTTDQYNAPITNCAGGVTPAVPHPVLPTPAPTPHSDPTPAPTPANPNPPPNPNPQCSGAATSVYYSTEGPDGPWQQKAVAAPPLGGFPYSVANPTPYIFANGSVLMLYRSYSDVRTGTTWNVGAPYPGYTLIGLATAPHWSGPYSLRNVPIFDNMNEDPYLYRDHRGNFHAVFHGMDRWSCNETPCTINVGRHAFSEDGLSWAYSRTNAWSTDVEYEDGSTIHYARRERPEFIFNKAGMITHLVNGIVDDSVGGGQQDYSFTLVQPVCAADSCAQGPGRARKTRPHETITHTVHKHTK